MQIENTKITRWIDVLSKSKDSAKNKKLIDYLTKLASKPKRQRISVNLYKLDMLANANDHVIVPGKVLGTGEIKKSINITAVDFSSSALEKLKGSKSKIVDISEIKGGVRIIV